MFADQQSIFIQWSCAAVGEIIANNGAGTDHGQFAAPAVGEFVGARFQARLVLRQERLDGLLSELRMIGRHAPINVAVAVRINGNDALDWGRRAGGGAPYLVGSGWRAGDSAR